MKPRHMIDITADIDYPDRDTTDSMVFALARELVSNVVRHSRATRATVSLRAVDGVCHLDVVDNGTGISQQDAFRRLQEGHIGLASQRERVEAAGGQMRIVPAATGTHISVTVPQTT